VVWSAVYYTIVVVNQSMCLSEIITVSLVLSELAAITKW